MKVLTITLSFISGKDFLYVLKCLLTTSLFLCLILSWLSYFFCKVRKKKRLVCYYVIREEKFPFDLPSISSITALMFSSFFNSLLTRFLISFVLSLLFSFLLLLDFFAGLVSLVRLALAASTKAATLISSTFPPFFGLTTVQPSSDWASLYSLISWRFCALISAKLGLLEAFGVGACSTFLAAFSVLVLVAFFFGSDELCCFFWGLLLTSPLAC